MADKFNFVLPSGNVMPALGFGTYAPQDGEEEVLKAVRAAIKAGYRHLDCAAIYRNERAVGQAIKQLIVESKITRKDVFVTSKLWNTCHRPDLVRSSLKKTLDDLGLDYVDQYLMHWPMGYKEGGEFIPRGPDGTVLYSDVDFVDTWKALEDCVDEGLVKDIGLSNFNKSQIERILEIARIKPSCNQVECHIHLAQTKLIEYCKSKNIAVTAYTPLGAPGSLSEPSPTVLEEPLIKQLASQKNKTVAQILIRFLLQRGIGVLPKSVTPARINENFQVFDFELSDDEMTQILALNKDRRLRLEDIALKHKYYPFYDEY